MPSRLATYLCAACATPIEEPGACPACGSIALIRVSDGYLSEFPAGCMPCPGCGGTTKPLVFRGWVRLLSLIWWVSEGRAAGYLCRNCARFETTKALLFSALLGWWSVPSFFFYGWRATCHNWRAIWTAPAKLHEWGAISAAEFAEDVETTREDAFAAAEEEWLFTETPLRDLSDIRARLVLSAEGLYELLRVSRNASTDELRRAFRQRAKEAHPDLREPSRQTTEEMMRLNRAWEILSDERMRLAYEWLEQQRAGQPVG